VRLSTGLIEQSRWEINRLLEGLRRPGVGVEELPPEDEAAPAMDYDAVIARHLAARQAGGASAAVSAARLAPPEDQPQAVRGGFGRKGL
jgi:hypothetical protein